MDSEYHNPEQFLKEVGMIIPVDKPTGWTSFDVTNKIRSHLRYQYNIPRIKVGHAGTLDPLATGLLIVCIGKKTKMISELQELDKSYTGIIRLGETTPSYDAETEVCEIMPTEHITKKMIKSAAGELSGLQMQVPPAFSAIRIEGKRAYKLARKDENIILPARPVNIYSFEILKTEGNDVFFEISCSRGTYIRAVARDLGTKLGSCAYLIRLRRTVTGHFSVTEAYTMANFDDALRILKT